MPVTHSVQSLSPETTLLKHRWPQIDMLDLGVGAGRTAYTFAAITRSYVGVDYAPRMVEWCRRRIGESESIKFLHADASKLGLLGEIKFDVVLFSYNGIDSVEHEQRLQILRQIRARLRDSNSLFFFSAHSLLCFPFRRELPKLRGQGLLRWILQLWRELPIYLRVRLNNAHHNRKELRRNGWAILRDGCHGLETAFYYILPEVQVQQLEKEGFSVLRVLDPSGNEVDWKNVSEEQAWLHYICRLKPSEPVKAAGG